MVIVQPYVPKYREEFFSKLIKNLNDHQVDCFIAASLPSGTQAERRDSIEAKWIRRYDARQLRMGGITIGLGGARTLWRDADGVIVGLLGSSLDTYLAINDARRRRVKVGLWGHINPYVRPGNPIDLAMERWQLRHADHVFAYTPGGRDYALSAGVSSQNVTTVMNATDTSKLVSAKETLDPERAAEFMAHHRLQRHRTLAYVGGLDASKRVDFLASALDQIWASDPDVRLLIGGQGLDAHFLQPSVDRGQAIMLGYVGPAELAMIGYVSSGILSPGRIGLVAVDALVLGVPILTTDWPFHAPEVEFLVEGQSRLTSANDVKSYIGLVRDFLGTLSDQGAEAPTAQWSYPTIDGMVENFESGIMKMLDK
ncbi:glycosyltransferase [Arthrobacter sp. FW306-04-A]|uniref:glycosyltransferase n=1 Tax=Arthrobacter sp. FW306-04-A TaxID=2879619 RepID=UPI0037C09904|nr:glycosyltransferase [Arthrobacter sp. FW306-04-A]